MERVKDPADPRRCKGSQPDGPPQPSRLAEFVEQHCARLPGLTVRYGDFCRRFVGWLPEVERPAWTRAAIGRELERLGIDRGLGSNGRIWLANIDLLADRPTLVRAGNKLVRI